MKIASLTKLLLIFLLIFSLSACASEDLKEEPAHMSLEENGEVVENPSSDTEVKEEASPDSEKTQETTNVLDEPPKEEIKAEAPPQKPAKPPKEEPAKTPSPEESTVENALKVQGNIGKELVLTLDDLKSLSDIIFEDEYYSLNNFGTTDHTLFKGVKLWPLLEEKAQISEGAAKVSLVATDGYQVEFSVDQVKKQDYMDETQPDKKFPMIIAWEENGQEYDPEEGPPFKLIVGQVEPGDINKPQWVSNIDKIVVE